MRSLRVAVIGGGPAGLFLARLMRLADPGGQVRLFERHGPDEAAGFGVVFSDRTLEALHAADPQTELMIRSASASWSDMELRLPEAVIRYGGYGFTGIGRQHLLRILRKQADRVGVELSFHHPLTLSALEHEFGGRPDVVVIADGVNSSNRSRDGGRFGTQIRQGNARYIWFGTEARFDAVTFPFVRTDAGTFAAHAYPYGDAMSTFIVEIDDATWSAAGMDLPRTDSSSTDEHARAVLSDVFAAHLGGHELVGNQSRWSRFQVVANARWWSDSMVLLGDAAHTAHFSVGSGTKLAMEDAIELAASLHRARTAPDAFAEYERRRRPEVSRTQRWAEASMRWWETYERRLHLPAPRFGMHFITRTGAISYAGLRRRHADRIDEAERAYAEDHSAGAVAPGGALGLPIQFGPVRLANREVAITNSVGPAATACGLVLRDPDFPAGGATAGPTVRPRVTRVDPGSPVVRVGWLLPPTPRDPAEFGRLARDRGVDAVELVAGPAGEEPTELLVARVSTLRAAAGAAIAVIAGITEPAETAWSPRGDAVVALCRRLGEVGADAVHLREISGWDAALAWADRIRTETGLLVVIDDPGRWAAAGGSAANHRAVTLGCAIVSGRIDLVASPATNGATGRSVARAGR